MVKNKIKNNPNNADEDAEQLERLDIIHKKYKMVLPLWKKKFASLLN